MARIKDGFTGVSWFIEVELFHLISQETNHPPQSSRNRNNETGGVLELVMGSIYIYI